MAGRKTLATFALTLIVALGGASVVRADLPHGRGVSARVGGGLRPRLQRVTRGLRARLPRMRRAETVRPTAYASHPFELGQGRGVPREAAEAFERVRSGSAADAAALRASLRGVRLEVAFHEPEVLADDATEADRQANVVEAITEISSAMRTPEAPSSSLWFEHMLDGMQPHFEDPELQQRVQIVQDFVDHAVQIRAVEDPAHPLTAAQRSGVQQLNHALAYRRLQFARYHFRLPTSRADNAVGLRVVATSLAIGGVAQGVEAIGLRAAAPWIAFAGDELVGNSREALREYADGVESSQLEDELHGHAPAPTRRRFGINRRVAATVLREQVPTLVSIAANGAIADAAVEFSRAGRISDSVAAPVYAAACTITAGLSAVRAMSQGRRGDRDAVWGGHYGALAKLQFDPAFQTRLRSVFEVASREHLTDTQVVGRIADLATAHMPDATPAEIADARRVLSGADGLRALVAHVRQPSYGTQWRTTWRAMTRDAPSRAAFVVAPVVATVALSALVHLAPGALDNIWVQTAFSSAENLASAVTSLVSERITRASYRLDTARTARSLRRANDARDRRASRS